MLQRWQITVLGQVQGVGFRNWAQRQASAMGINGYVKNKADGTVFIDAEADEMILNRFVQLCRRGPSRAEVTELEVQKVEPRKFTGFSIDF